MLFRILKTVTLTTISELDDSSKNLSCQEHHRLGLRWDTKAEKQRKALKEFTERQQANRIVNQDVNLFHSSSRRLRIFLSKKTTYKTDKWTKYSARRKHNFMYMLVNKLHAESYTQL